MARLYLDHNIPLRLAPLLELAGHDVRTARDVGHESLPDDALLLYSVLADRVFITHNRKDFRMLHDAWVTWPAAFSVALPPHPGILVADSAPPETLARALTEFLNEMTTAERLANGVFWWHRHDGWRQPITGARWEPRQQPGEIEQE